MFRSQRTERVDGTGAMFANHFPMLIRSRRSLAIAVRCVDLLIATRRAE